MRARDRRAALTAILVALACLLAPSLAGADGPAPEAPKKSCLKIRHSKIVVVKVKRGGKWVKVKRRKVWWACDPFEAPGPPRLRVAAKEFKLTLSRPYVKSGDLVLEFGNRGEDDHDLKIGPATGGAPFASVPQTKPGTNTTVTVPIQPGRYRMWCSLPGHAKLGMKAKLRVAAG